MKKVQCFMTKRWQIYPTIDIETQKLFPQINPIILQLLANRNIKTQKAIDSFFNFDYQKQLHDPFIFRDMEKAVRRIFKAISEKEKIAIYGDYDADGICSSVILHKTLVELGSNPLIYIPHRDLEGYGLKEKAIKILAKKKVNLIITVDCGISTYQEVVLANKLGLDVIITDHHHVPERIPPALAVINPKASWEKYPFKDLAGVGVAFKLAQALISKHKKNINDQGLRLNWEGFEKWLLDLVAIGTVADCVDVLRENRTLVKYGLTVLNKTKSSGIKEIIKAARLEKNGGILTAEKVSFQIAPRLNAAGRMSHANNAFDLLITKSIDEARQLAQDLEKSNGQRQRLTEKVLEEARLKLEKKTGQKLIFISGKNWPASIIGLVAGKISDQFNLPVIIVSEVEKKIVGSGRSIEEFDIIEAIEEFSDYFSHFGGHPQACGFTLKNKKHIAKLEKEIVQLADKKLAQVDLTPVLKIDAEINLSQIDWTLYGEIINFSPFGLGNPEPVFLTKGLSLLSHRQVGQNGKHLKLFLSNQEEENTSQFDGIGFNLAERWLDKIKAGDKLDLIYKIEANHWNGTQQLQLKVMDIRIN